LLDPKRKAGAPGEDEAGSAVNGDTKEEAA
jgi:hypothetical protein